mgnify:FL=1
MTLFELGQRFIGAKEITGSKDNPLIVWMLQLSNPVVEDDETHWCSAYVNAMAWILRRPRSKSNTARSWLGVGLPIGLIEARAEWDIVILQRGSGIQPGPEVLHGAPGHVGLFAGLEGQEVLILGGNQANAVNISRYPISRVLGVRRLV